MEDLPINMNNARRRSNSSSQTHGSQAFKTKFELVEAEPVFEDMPQEEANDEEQHIRLEQQSSSSSSEGQSVEEDHN
jgi:hypothetical protein